MGSGSKPGAVGKAEVFNGVLNDSKCCKKLAYRCNVAITKAYPQRASNDEIYDYLSSEF